MVMESQTEINEEKMKEKLKRTVVANVSHSLTHNVLQLNEVADYTSKLY